MKKNVLIKGILVLVVIAVFALTLVGCIPCVGTGYIVVSGVWYYDLLMDSVQKFPGVSSGTYVLYDVPVGNHFFEAIHTWGSWAGYDSVTQYITYGVNHVYLNP